MVNDNLQQFKYNWDQCIMTLSAKQPDDQLKTLFLLQLDQLPLQHEFTIEYKIWSSQVRPTERTITELCDFVDKFLSQKVEKRNREQILSEACPEFKLKAKQAGINVQTGEKSPCYAWRNYGNCKRHESGNCPWTHLSKDKHSTPKGDGKGSDKGKGKGKKGKGKGAKNGSQRSPSAGGGGTPRNTEVRRKIVLDMSLLCQKHLKGQCKAGGTCKYHHNEPCKFYSLGTCSHGDKCPFPHVSPNSKAATPKAAPKAKAKAKAAASGEPQQP